MLNWISNAFNSVTGKIDSTVASWVRSLISGLYGYLVAIFSPVGKWWKDLESGFDRLQTLLTGWGVQVVTHLQDLYNWINKEGSLVYGYITDPAKLAALVIDPIVAALESGAVKYGEQLGEFALNLILKNLKQFLTIVEAIVDAVL